MSLITKYRSLKRKIRRRWYALKKHREAFKRDSKGYLKTQFPEIYRLLSRAIEVVASIPFRKIGEKIVKRVFHRVLTLLRRVKWRFLKMGKDYRFRKQLNFLPQHILIEEAKNPVLVRLFSIVICLFFVAFFGWASISQLNEVAKTQGEIIPDGYIQKIQHLDGGVVENILVQEGDYIEKGAVIAVLTDPEAISEHERISQKVKNLNYEAQRLQHVIQNKPIPFYLVETNHDPLFRSNFALLEAAKKNYRDQERVLQRQIDQKRSYTSMLREKLNILKENLAISNEVLGIKKALYDQGYATKPSLLDAEVEVNNLEGEKNEIEKELSKSLIAIDEFETRIESLRSEFENNAWEKYVQVASEIQENKEILGKLKAQMNSFVIKSPSSGFVYGLSVNTIGGVVKPGEVITQIVPMNKDLFAEVRIQPKDIAHVKIGQNVAIKVSSFEFPRYGTLSGRVVSLSAASFKTDQGISYYKGIVQMEKNYFGNDPIKNLVIPGMELEADIITGEKSVLSYLLKPIYLSINTAMHER